MKQFDAKVILLAVVVTVLILLALASRADVRVLQADGTPYKFPAGEYTLEWTETHVQRFAVQPPPKPPEPLPEPPKPIPEPIPEPPNPKPIPQPTPVEAGATFADAIATLNAKQGGFFEIDFDGLKLLRTPRDGEGGNLRGSAAWRAYNGAGWDFRNDKVVIYNHGGGHDDGGMIDVYQTDLTTGKGVRIYTPPEYNCVIKGTKGKEGKTAFARRHQPDLPESTHVYDGILFDEHTGLLIVVTGIGYTAGYKFSETNPWPHLPKCSGRGHGIYAFNPTDAEIKKVPPRGWRRLHDKLLAEFPGSSYVASASLPDGRFVLGTVDRMVLAEWRGDEFFVDEANAVKVDKGNTPAIEVVGGKLIRLNRNVVESFTFDLQKIKRWPIELTVIGSPQYALAPYGDDILIWQKGNVVISLSDDGTWKKHKYPVTLTKNNRGSAALYSKWAAVPHHSGYFVGWNTPYEPIVVYKHDPNNGIPGGITKWDEPSIETQIKNGGQVVTLNPGNYEKGAKIIAPIEVDAKNVKVYRPHNNGFFTAEANSKSDQIVIKNLHACGATGVWGQQERNVPEGQPVGRLNLVVDNFSFGSCSPGRPLNKHGLHTSPYHQGALRVELTNGVINDGGDASDWHYHPVYIGKSDQLIVDNVTIKRAWSGHLFKTGSKVVTITNSRFDGSADGIESAHARIIDAYCAERVELTNSMFVRSPKSVNDDLISVGIGDRCPPSVTPVLVLTDTTWIAPEVPAERGVMPLRRFMSTHYGATVECHGTNVFPDQIFNPCP